MVRREGLGRLLEDSKDQPCVRPRPEPSARAPTSMAELRMTIPTQRVLRAMLEDTSAERYGIEIADLAALATGTVHPDPRAP